jgi:hypothetical protein
LPNNNWRLRLVATTIQTRKIGGKMHLNKLQNSSLRVRIKATQLALATLTTAAFTVISAHGGILAQWHFDEVSGTTAHDSVGSFNGTLSAQGAAFVPGGISGNAIGLSRVANGTVSMGNVLMLTNTPFSVVAWIKMNANDTTQDTVVLSKHAAFSNNGYEVTVNISGGGGAPNKAQFYEGTVFGSPTSTMSVNDGNWHQIVGVHRPGAQTLIYVDGAPAEDIKPSQPFLPNVVAFIIGGDAQGGNPVGKFTGWIDEVQVYDNPLGDAEVNFLFNHPAEIVLDCPQQLQLVQNQLNSANAANAALQQELSHIDTTLSNLGGQFGSLFHNSEYEIPGATPSEQIQNLANAIHRLNYGQQQALFFNLGGRKKATIGNTAQQY